MFASSIITKTIKIREDSKNTFLVKKQEWYYNKQNTRKPYKKQNSQIWFFSVHIENYWVVKIRVAISTPPNVHELILVKSAAACRIVDHLSRGRGPCAWIVTFLLEPLQAKVGEDFQWLIHRKCTTAYAKKTADRQTFVTN